ncbi:MAG: hypothetical protein JSV50_12400 [Desulfobacteraceae bacterium]|nr:MAG: hypothetical protein JSV50_12400 [Desulfobacteraceae bacterium]
MRTYTFLKNLSFFYVFATVLLVLGFMGIALGTYVQFFRPATPGELMLNKSLFLYSIGFVFSALVHFGAFGTIKRLSKRG